MTLATRAEPRNQNLEFDETYQIAMRGVPDDVKHAQRPPCGHLAMCHDVLNNSLLSLIELSLHRRGNQQSGLRHADSV